MQSMPAPEHDTMYTEEVQHPWYEPRGFSLSLGGGVEDFVGDAATSTTSTGGDWTVRGTWGTHSILAFEGSYIGSAQSIDAIGLDNNAVLVGNGAQGALRLNLMEDVVQPFIYAGAAWRHYQITNETQANTSDIANDDDVFELPVGVGVAGYIPGGFTADVRAEYRTTWSNDLIPDNSLSNDNTIGSALDRFGLNASIGANF
jgi:hypothetical protein